MTGTKRTQKTLLSFNLDKGAIKEPLGQLRFAAVPSRIPSQTNQFVVPGSAGTQALVADNIHLEHFFASRNLTLIVYILQRVLVDTGDIYRYLR
jgi:hypothetical protein